MTSYVREIHQIMPAPDGLTAQFTAGLRTVVALALVSLRGDNSSERSVLPMVMDIEKTKLVVCADLPGFTGMRGGGG